MAISSPGIGSGLDVNSIVSQLMTVEQQPLTALATKESTYQAQITAYGSLKSALSTFQSTAAKLASPAIFSATTASIADTTVASATGSTSALAGTYSLEVQTLAQAQKLKSPPFATNATTVGTGTLTIQFGTYSAGVFTLNGNKATASITVDSSHSSLSGVRDAINAANAGVSASIVNDGTAYRLVVASRDSGVANALKITVTDADLANTDNAGLSQLAYDASTGGTTNLTQTLAAQNAVAVVDGITINHASNTLTEAIQGVTLNLLNENPGSPTTLTVARDTSGVQTALQSFVKAYNDLGTTITNLTKYDAQNKKPSTLTGDATVRSLQNQLRNVFNAVVPTGNSGLRVMSDVGISFQADGTLKLDSTKLSSVLSDSTKDVSALFAAVGKPSDSLASFVGATTDTKNGDYALNVTQLATRGTAVGGASAALTISSGSNDTLNVTVDGVAASVTLAAGVYSAASLAAEIKSKINGATALSAVGMSTDVTDSGGVLTITSDRYGSASTVDISGGTAKTDVFGTPIETAGVNVAGSIGGVGATGVSQMLTVGSGDAHGLAVSVTGGTTGARGTVHFARGYAYELNALLGSVLDDNGLIDDRLDGINSSIKSIDTQRDALSLRLTATEARYRAQFSALDTLISSMTQTSNFLTQQLANLPQGFITVRN